MQWVLAPALFLRWEQKDSSVALTLGFHSELVTKGLGSQLALLSLQVILWSRGESAGFPQPLWSCRGGWMLMEQKELFSPFSSPSSSSYCCTFFLLCYISLKYFSSLWYHRTFLLLVLWRVEMGIMYSGLQECKSKYPFSYLLIFFQELWSYGPLLE